MKKHGPEPGCTIAIKRSRMNRSLNLAIGGAGKNIAKRATCPIFMALAPFLLAFPAASSEGTPAGPQIASPLQVCQIIEATYKRTLHGNPVMAAGKDSISNGLIGLSATIARHQTLDRLLTIAWSRQCDLGKILEMERARVNDLYPLIGVN